MTNEPASPVARITLAVPVVGSAVVVTGPAIVYAGRDITDEHVLAADEQATFTVEADPWPRSHVTRWVRRST